MLFLCGGLMKNKILKAISQGCHKLKEIEAHEKYIVPFFMRK